MSTVWRVALALVLLILVVVIGHGLWGAHQQDSHVKQHNDCAFQALQTGQNPDVVCAP